MYCRYSYSDTFDWVTFWKSSKLKANTRPTVKTDCN